MKVAIVYLKIVKRVENYGIATPYEIGHKRFFNGYRQFKPIVPHDLIIVRCGDTEKETDFDSIATHYMRFDGLGSDCATYQSIVSVLDYDLVLCMNTLAYPWRLRWLEPFVEAMEIHGKGIYGATASYEVHPHLRTPSIAFHPDLIREYPFQTTNRQDSCRFEASPNSISAWADRVGYPVVLVAADGRYYRVDWRKGKNIFRRGDQSNCLIFDRHTDIYRDADPATKKQLELSADTLK